MNKRRLVIVMFALVGAVLGAVLGAVAVPHTSRYTVSANIALLPGPNLTTVEASNFWEVLTRGQVTRTAAIVYDDPRWLISAAKAAKTRADELTLTAAALPETTVLQVTVTAPTASAADAALSDVLTTATPDVVSLVVPYEVKVLMPPPNSASGVPAPSRVQTAAAGALAGLLIAGGVGWLVDRRRHRATEPVAIPSERLDEEVVHR